MSRDELRSQLYAFLGDRTIQPIGYEWEHERLRKLVDSLMDLSAMRGLLTAREAVRALAVEMVAQSAGSHDDDDYAYRDAAARIRTALGDQ